MKAKTKYRLAQTPCIVLCVAALIFFIAVIVAGFLANWQKMIVALSVLFALIAAFVGGAFLLTVALDKYGLYLERLKRAAEEEVVDCSKIRIPRQIDHEALAKSVASRIRDEASRIRDEGTACRPSSGPTHSTEPDRRALEDEQGPQPAAGDAA